MIDKEGRRIDYLRISITDRCNLRCIYCMPQEGIPSMRHEEILRFEEIFRLVEIMTGLGIRHLRITGGEPMTRKGCLELAGRLHDIPGVESISMTTNGILLKDHIHQAKRSGISALNISIDSLNPETYSRMTRGGEAGTVLETIRQSLDEGLSVKTNTVLIRGYNEKEMAQIAALALQDPVCVRFIELMPIGPGALNERIPCGEVMRNLEDAFGEPESDPEAHGHGPARYVKYPGFRGSVGFISAVSHEFCEDCNRVRLTADGRLKLCLNHTKGLNLRDMLRSGAGDDQIREAVREAMIEKPLRHGFFETGNDYERRSMNAIGG